MNDYEKIDAEIDKAVAEMRRRAAEGKPKEGKPREGKREDSKSKSRSTTKR